MKNMTIKNKKNLGILNCLTLFVLSGTRNILIFLDANSFPQTNGNKKKPQIN